MGVTSFDIPLLEEIIKWHQPESVIELGAQNNYAQPHLPAPYMREWYQAKKINYESIDLNGEDGAFVLDLSEKIPPNQTFDLVTDFGTSEHVGKNGEFSWEAIYNCWLNKHTLLNIGGVMFSENPKTGNWPGHGFNYYTYAFYVRLILYTDYKMLLMREHAAMNNVKDGWNVVAIMKKTSERFPTFEEFKTLDLRPS